ncbi:MAG TPA: hypothetical protein VGQ33_18185 [Vicinamibacteria bacterium]|nr:hypothetical protein [Vicinamibacteria bacterium]
MLAALHAAIRRRGRLKRKPRKEVAVAALAEGLRLVPGQQGRRDLSDVVKTWRRDAVVEAALAAQDRVDERIWE